MPGGVGRRGLAAPSYPINPTIVDAANLRACSAALQGITIAAADFRHLLQRVKPRDFVYFDPPYAPLSATADFTSYTKEGFVAEMQYALRDLCRDLDRKGVYFMVSNSAAPLIQELYSEFNLNFVHAPRFVNSKADSRGMVEEVVVTNYKAFP